MARWSTPIFRDANGGVLTDPRVKVGQRDGRQHLRMQPEAAYDQITTRSHRRSRMPAAALYS
jgi:spermidine synthase